MNFPDARPIPSYLKDTLYSLVPSPEIEASKSNHGRIAAICDEKAVYHYLFRDVLNGDPYTPGMAEGFLAAAKDGWTNNRWFVFFVPCDDAKQYILVVIGASDQGHKKLLAIVWMFQANSSKVSECVTTERCLISRWSHSPGT